jgi:Zn finger protein HypA/HybF involved in hydrogenase expression
MQLFDFTQLEKEVLECEECGWRGCGYETEKGYKSLPETIEVYCPVCKNFLGEVKKEDESAGAMEGF